MRCPLAISLLIGACLLAGQHGACLENATTTSSSTATAAVIPQKWRFTRGGLRLTRDEFNSTEGLHGSKQLAMSGSGGPSGGQSGGLQAPEHRWHTTGVLKRVLLRYQLPACCPSWANLSQLAEIQEERGRLFGRSHKQPPAAPLRAQELLGELKQVFVNITYLSIEGQAGESAWEKYYKFYDDVHYYLRLMIVAESHLEELERQEARLRSNGSAAVDLLLMGSSATGEARPALSGQAGLEQAAKQRKLLEDVDFRRQFKRNVRSIGYKVSRDPTISSFLAELLPAATSLELLGSSQLKTQSMAVVNEHFELYESFIRYTEFGQQYARNISLVRESVSVFDLICSHLIQLNFPSNLTRPSTQYAMLRRMSLELYRIRRDLLDKINLRILSQHADVKRIFNRLNDLVAERPEIRLLGDEFGLSSNEQDLVAGEQDADPVQFGQSVRHLAHLLDGYTTNNLTQLSFYNELAALPEDFILLGLAVAHEYETKELPQYNRFYHQLELEASQAESRRDNAPARQNATQSHANATAGVDSARQSSRPFLSKLFG